MKKKMITLIIATLVLGGAVFGAVSAVYAQKTDTNVREDALVEPAVYRGAWAGNGGCRGACNGTCDLSQDQTHLRLRLQVFDEVGGVGFLSQQPPGCQAQEHGAAAGLGQQALAQRRSRLQIKAADQLLCFLRFQPCQVDLRERGQHHIFAAGEQEGGRCGGAEKTQDAHDGRVGESQVNIVEAEQCRALVERCAAGI